MYNCLHWESITLLYSIVVPSDHWVACHIATFHGMCQSLNVMVKVVDGLEQRTHGAFSIRTHCLGTYMSKKWTMYREKWVFLHLKVLLSQGKWSDTGSSTCAHVSRVRMKNDVYLDCLHRHLTLLLLTWPYIYVTPLIHCIWCTARRRSKIYWDGENARCVLFIPLYTKFRWRTS